MTQTAPVGILPSCPSIRPSVRPSSQPAVDRRTVPAIVIGARLFNSCPAPVAAEQQTEELSEPTIPRYHVVVNFRPLLKHAVHLGRDQSCHMLLGHVARPAGWRSAVDRTLTRGKHWFEANYADREIGYQTTSGSF